MGRHRCRQHRPVTRPNTDYFYVYQGSSVGFTTAQLLANDSDPQSQTLTVVAVSEPSNNGTLTGTLATGYTYTPGPTPPSSAPTANSTTSSPTPTATSPKAPSPSASSPPTTPTTTRRRSRHGTARTRATTVAVYVLGNDFDPDGDSFSVVEVATPAHGTVVSSLEQLIHYTPTTGFSGVETITYTLRDNHGLTATGLVTVLVGTTGNQPPVAQSADYSVRPAPRCRSRCRPSTRTGSRSRGRSSLRRSVS